MFTSRRLITLGVAAAAAAALTAGALIARTAEAAVQIGAPAPAFSAPDTTGATRSLSEFAGKTVVLEWTNHDCPFVRKHYDSDNMQQLQREAAAQGVVWLSVISSAPGKQGHVSASEADALTQSRNAAPAAVLLDPQGTMGRAYGAKTTPHMYVIKDGALVYQGGIDNRNSASQASLEGAVNYVRLALADIAGGRPVGTASSAPYGCSVKY